MIELANPSQAVESLLHGLTPDPVETISDWADQHMVLPSWNAEPGRWRTSRTPYLREIMDVLSPSSPIREVVFMKPAQIGGTEAGKNWVGYTIHRAPSTMLLVEPSLDVAAKLSKQKIQPMLDLVPCLSGLVRESRSRDSGNTITSKEFNGGMLCLTGANSGPGLRFMSARNLFLDECDAYPFDVNGEGSPCELAEKRTLTYARHKIYRCSTPLLKQTSVIEKAYSESDQRRFFVPCPFCDHGQVLWWKNLDWPKGKPEEAKFLCEQCHRHIAEAHKPRMLEQGVWIAQAAGDGTRPKAAGFWMNALYAPYGWVNSWQKLASDWSEINHKHDLRAQQTFINTNLAETWEEAGERIEGSDLHNRIEIYPAPVPEPVVCLTAGIDVQKDRIEAELVGWGKGQESWSIAYRKWFGSPTDKTLWEQVDAWLKQPWDHETGGFLTVATTCVDTGHHAKEVYEFVQPRQGRRVWAVKGSSQPGAPACKRGSTINGIRLFIVGTDTLKDTLFDRLKLTEFGPGYCHFPDQAAYTEDEKEYFKQLTAEERVNKWDRGVLVGSSYRKKRSRNEALDLRIYAMAALSILNPNLEKLTVMHHEPAPASPPADALREPEAWVYSQRVAKPRSSWMKRER
jgi:phage terminase large subunit GpA-like protein